jgi:putative addiction module component (TIGR02574 family)
VLSAFCFLLSGLNLALSAFEMLPAFQFPLLPIENLDYNDNMSIDQIAAEALRLPPRERALLAESLWESLSDPHETSAELDDRAALALARERDQQIEAGEVSPVLHDEMMARLRR